jgi:hypothetical protein
MRGGHILRLSIEQIYKAESGSKIIPKNNQLTKVKYRGLYWNNLNILKDEKTIVGIRYYNFNRILKENIENSENEIEPEKFKKHGDEIMIISVSEEYNTLLMSDIHWRIFHYNLTLKKVTRKYEFKNFGQIYSINIYENIVMIGGGNHRIQVIDLLDQLTDLAPLETAIKTTFWSTLCVFRQNADDPTPKAFLAIIGTDPDYTTGKFNKDGNLLLEGERTDIFDATKLFTKYVHVDLVRKNWRNDPNQNMKIKKLMSELTFKDIKIKELTVELRKKKRRLQATREELRLEGNIFVRLKKTKDPKDIPELSRFIDKKFQEIPEETLVNDSIQDCGSFVFKRMSEDNKEKRNNITKEK